MLGGAVLEYLDGIHRVEWDGGHVDEAAFAVVAQGIGNHTFAVDLCSLWRPRLGVWLENYASQA
jgi:hypothetical protein